ncbi:MAG TPA: ATP-binding cassette domain-containing protein [Bacteroidales bacterium]|mgnify:CR=1 FL=1|nr:ATP-binding cassette domain-containing protein [Bacteroidales bacterium]
MLRVNNLTVFYENAIAINKMTIDVKKDEVIGVIGPNSAGKTTLMNTISGLILDSKLKEDRKGGVRISIFGKVYFEGEDITDVWPDKRVQMGIALCRERHPIFGESNVEENLKIAAYLRPRNEIKNTFALVYETFPKLQLMRKRKAGLLSGGEQQMLAIGIALMTHPRLLLLDEPLLGLSPNIQVQLVEAILKIKKDLSLTVVIAEQFARPLIPIIDRGYVIENGMLAFGGSRDELYDNPDVRKAYFGVDFDEE